MLFVFDQEFNLENFSFVLNKGELKSQKEILVGKNELFIQSVLSLCKQFSKKWNKAIYVSANVTVQDEDIMTFIGDLKIMLEKTEFLNK